MQIKLLHIRCLAGDCQLRAANEACILVEFGRIAKSSQQQLAACFGSLLNPKDPFKPCLPPWQDSALPSFSSSPSISVLVRLTTTRSHGNTAGWLLWTGWPQEKMQLRLATCHLRRPRPANAQTIHPSHPVPRKTCWAPI